MAEERGIDRARRELAQERAKSEDDDFMKKTGAILAAGVKLKKLMVDRGLTATKTKCPNCQQPESLKGRLVVGQAAGRHRRSGGAFRMWCETPGCGAQMME